MSLPKPLCAADDGGAGALGIGGASRAGKGEGGEGGEGTGKISGSSTLRVGVTTSVLVVFAGVPGGVGAFGIGGAFRGGKRESRVEVEAGATPKMGGSSTLMLGKPTGGGANVLIPWVRRSDATPAPRRTKGACWEERK
jgi:hypothetical protein